jgi:class 3 adenylate cyclase
LAFYGILVPWSQLAFVFLPAALVGGLIGERQNRLTKIITMNSLRPAFSESSAKILARVVAAKEDENMTRERIVTLVNIDVVGFAKTIENTLPEESTRQISSFLEIIFDLVHKHGGFVSDYSPDHILAVFGHGLGAKRAKTERNHVRVALQCATEIQAKSVELMHVLGTGVSSPFPVRIAINSSMVRLGLVQIGEKVEFKTIGVGVALARQLSSHCEPFRILLSSSSAEILKVDAGEPMASLGLARSIGTDSSPELLTVFELDPFADDRELLDKATDIYRSYNNIKREDNRFAFPRGAEPLLRSHLGNFEVLDFSLTGMRLKSATYLSAGSVFQAWPAEFDAASPEFKMNLTVHWGAPDKASPTGREKFFLGVRYSGHSPEELAAMVAYFHKQLALCNDGVGELPRAETEEDWAS